MNTLQMKHLVEKVAYERDEQSYKSIFLFCYNPLLKFALSITHLREAAEEIVSDVMMNVWEMGEQFANITNLKVYLFKAVKNRAVNYISRTKKVCRLELDSFDLGTGNFSFGYSPEEIFAAKEIRQALNHSIKKLPPKCQTVYKLIREEGLSYKEVADIMCISENTVDRHLTIALQKLIRSMKIRFAF
jgi:RNA polymerase sigma-70 factor (family 1)